MKKVRDLTEEELDIFMDGYRFGLITFVEKFDLQGMIDPKQEREAMKDLIVQIREEDGGEQRH